MKKSFSAYSLIFLMFFLVISAVPGGWMLIADPSGANLGFTTAMLKHSPFSNFLIPGLFLFIVLGICPAIIFYGLISKKDFKIANKVNLYKQYHWSWTFSYYIGLILVMWINLELIFIREYSFLHVIYSIVGIVIIILTHLPATKRDYNMEPIKQE